MRNLIIASTRSGPLGERKGMQRLAASLALSILVWFPASAAVAAPERWIFEVLDAQTDAVSGQASVVAAVDNMVSPAATSYSLRFHSKKFRPGSYSLVLDVSGIQRRVDFASRSNAGARLHVDPILVSSVDANSAAVPTVYFYSGNVVVYRGVLKRGSGNPGPTDGMGMITGQCGVIASSIINAPAPALFENALDFGADPYDPTDFGRLSAGAQAILGSPTPPTSSALARAFEFEVLRRCEAAQLLKTADEIEYLDEGGKKADVLLQIAGWKIGVTFSRAFKFPVDAPLTIAEAKSVLEGKLREILASNQNVAPSDKWVKQILHIMASSHEHAASLRSAYATIDPSLMADTVLLITVTDGADLPLYE